MKKLLRAGAGLLLLLASSWVRADSIEWIGWSADESRYAYFLRKPYGESGYTSIYLIVRKSADGKEVSRFTVRDAKRLLSLPKPPNETAKGIAKDQRSWITSLRGKGYKSGRVLPYKLMGVLKQASRAERPGIPNQEYPNNPRVVMFGVPLLFDIWTNDALRICTLIVRRMKGEPTPIKLDREHLQLYPSSMGSPPSEYYPLRPTDPTGFYLSSSGRWMASLWIGKATLPDGFSWPAFVFHFPTSRLPRR